MQGTAAFNCRCSAQPNGFRVTTLIAWIAFDNKFAAAYMASDSRITWDSQGVKRWDAGRKIFASKTYSDILGYAGDVVFPALALSQLIEAFDANTMFNSDATPWERHEIIKRSLKDSYAHRHHTDDRDFHILHLSRWDGEPRATVHAWCLEYAAAGKAWTDRVLEIPTSTGIIERIGSGVPAAKTHERLWAATYSREIFSSFCDAISSGTDSLSGGAAQLAGFYPRGVAKTFGILRDSKAFLNGLPVHAPISNSTIEWRDHLFQRIDISTGKLLEGAQVHTRPKGK